MKIPSPNIAREIKNAFEQKKTDLANKQKEELRLEKKKKIEVGKICREIIQNAFQASLKDQPYLLVAPTDISSDQALIANELEAKGFLLSKVRDIKANQKSLYNEEELDRYWELRETYHSNIEKLESLIENWLEDLEKSISESTDSEADEYDDFEVNQEIPKMITNQIWIFSDPSNSELT